MQYALKFGKGEISFDLEEKNCMRVLLPNEMPVDLTGEREVTRSLENPIGCKRLREIVRPKEKIAIVTSDITRPMPSGLVLAPLLRELKDAGADENDITVILALGSHRGHTEEEKRQLVGEEIHRSGAAVIDSDPDRCVNLGTCKNGTPVDIFRPVAEADRVICLGNIEYHYFAGYSGGAKAIMPGVSSRAAIQANHSNMVHASAIAGNLETNPVRQDIDEVGNFVKIDFIVNVILNSQKEIVKAVSGHYIKAHRQGCGILDQMYGVKIQKQADIVIASPGGHPKDINLYQSQKGLDNAKHAVRDGGIIILCASAKEGFGEKTFEEWMLTKSPSEMIREIQTNFRLGGHKAAAIAMILQRAKLFMVSDLEPALLKKVNLVPFNTVQAAVDRALRELGTDSRVLILPAAGSTLPILSA
ncbi:MAG: nickel-dependent lactate racemase [Clostridiales Family XIII bacterium]|jgi:nickel-dependent lactate racemase|nr:nickel-dependent lactate racemase [Clostridiales Family XIII bacterium]